MEKNEHEEHEEKSQVQENAQDTEEPKVKEPEMISVDKEEYEALKNQVKEQQDRYLRLLAETENARKRMLKEKSELQAYAKENLVCEFLTPIDLFENAMKASENVADEVKNWMIGFEMILTQFKDVLAQNDIRPIHAMGQKFDPHLHEALEAVEHDDHPINTIIQEYVRGYRMGERVIRPSKVKVTKKKSDQPKKEEGSSEESKETINQKEG